MKIEHPLPITGLARPKLPAEFHMERSRSLLLLIICLAFVALGVYDYPDSTNENPMVLYHEVVSISAIGLFGVLSLIFIWFFIRNPWIFAFYPEGIKVKSGHRIVTWDNIVSVTPFYRKDRKRVYVRIEVKDAASSYMKPLLPNTKMENTVLINSSFAGIEPAIICHWIKGYCSDRKTKPTP